MKKIKGLAFGLAALMIVGAPATVMAAPANFGTAATYKVADTECSSPKTKVKFSGAQACITYTVTEDNKVEMAENVNDILALTLPVGEYPVTIDGVEQTITNDGDTIYVGEDSLVDYVTYKVDTTQTDVDLTVTEDVTKVFSAFKKAYSLPLADMDYVVLIGDCAFKNLFYAAGVFQADINDETEVLFQYEDGVLVFDGDYQELLGGLGEGAEVTYVSGHETQKYEAVEVSPYEVGNIEYYQCENCGKYFADEDATQEIPESEVFIYPFAADATNAIGEFDGVYYAVGEDRVCDSSKNGAVCGVVEDTKGWYVAEEGIINLDYKGFALVGQTWWYFEKGKINKSKNGTVSGTIDGKKAWYVVNNGKANLNYTGFAKVGSSWMYYSKGSYDKSKTGAISGTIDGKKAWYYVKSGKYQSSYKGIAKVGSSKYYFKNGKLDKTYTGTYTQGDTTYIIKNGKVVGTK